MSLRLYMEVNVRRAITDALRADGIDVITAQEDGSAQLTDAELLDRASALGRVLFTHDDDLLREAACRQRDGLPFAGVLFAHQMHTPIGACVADLKLIAEVCSPADMEGVVEYIPLR